MGTFSSYDGTKLAYHAPAVSDERRFCPREVDESAVHRSDPLVCLPGGPMQASSYLSGLPLDNVIRLDLRGTGESEQAPKETYRVDRQVDDVEAFRQDLGLGRLRLFGHSAGGTLAILYATRYPQHVEELVLVAPSPRVVGIDVTDDDRREVALQRSGEPWYAEAVQGFEEIWAGNLTPEAFEKIGPFWHGKWDDAARALDDHPRNGEAAEEFYAEGALDPEVTRAALKTLDVPTLLLTGEVDVALPPKCAREYAELIPCARHVIQQGAGHFPWLDDPEAFAAIAQRMP